MARHRDFRDRPFGVHSRETHHRWPLKRMSPQEDLYSSEADIEGSQGVMAGADGGGDCNCCLPPYIPTLIGDVGEPVSSGVYMQRPSNATGTTNPLLFFAGTGDSTVAGHVGWAKSGLFEYVTATIAGATHFTGFRVVGFGTIVVHFEGSMTTVIDAGTSTCTFSILKNGVVVAQDAQSYSPGGLSGWSPSSTFDTGPIDVVDGDVFTATMSMVGFPRMEQIVVAGVGTLTDGLWVTAGAMLAPEIATLAPPVECQFHAESLVGDGTMTLFQTNYPYAEGGLEVHVNGLLTPVTSTDPLIGQFTFATAPATGAVIIVTYHNAGIDGTGATNPYPVASTPVVGGGGSPLTVSDEGVALATAASGLDFVGAGVTVTGTGATKTVTIPGGGGGGGGLLNNLTATTDPLVTSDSAAGYSVGSQWLNTTTRVLYVCKVATAGAAVWHSMSGNYVVLSVGTSATAYLPDASIPRMAAGYFRDIDGNSGAGILQWYRQGSFNSVNGVATGNHGYQFQNTTLSGGGTGFSFFIESNAAGARLGVKNNNSGFARDFLICVF